MKLSGDWKRKDPTVFERRYYNGFYQLVRVIQDDQEIMYQYRGDGLRHSREVRKLTESEGKVSRLSWDGMNVVAECVDNESMKKYLRGINLIAGETDGVLYYYIQNEHGDVTHLWGPDGRCRASYIYDAFGSEKSPDEEDENPFRYCGEYLDSETDTYYLRARDYRPSTGRFTQEDPIRDGLNWYAYANNNPTIFIDPSGLVAVEMYNYAETYEGSTITYYDKPDSASSYYTISWNGQSFDVMMSDLFTGTALCIDDSLFVNAFGVGTDRIVVYEDAVTGNVSIRAAFNISGKGINNTIPGSSVTYKDAFFKGIEDDWNGTFGKYNVSTYTGESSNGINVKLSDKNGVSNVTYGLFGWSKSNPGKVAMFIGDSRGTGTPYSEAQYKRVAAHEFGHTLGVGDAYNSKKSLGVTSIYNDMFNTGVQEIDIDMVTKAWRLGKFQNWK